MQVKIEKHGKWEFILLAFIIPTAMMMLTWRLLNKEMTRMGDASVFIPIGYYVVGIAWAIRKALKAGKTLTLLIADGMFILNDGRKNIIEENEKEIELVLDKVTTKSKGVINPQLGFRFINRRTGKEVLLLITSFDLHYQWKPEIASKYIWGILGRYEIEKDEALKIVRHYGVHSPIV